MQVCTQGTLSLQFGELSHMQTRAKSNATMTAVLQDPRVFPGPWGPSSLPAPHPWAAASLLSATAD